MATTSQETLARVTQVVEMFQVAMQEHMDKGFSLVNGGELTSLDSKAFQIQEDEYSEEGLRLAVEQADSSTVVSKAMSNRLAVRYLCRVD